MATNTLANDILKEIRTAIGTGSGTPYTNMQTARANMALSAKDIQTDATLIKTEAETVVTAAQEDYNALEVKLDEIISLFDGVANEVSQAVEELDYKQAAEIDIEKLTPKLEIGPHIPSAESLEMALTTIPTPLDRGVKDVSSEIESNISEIKKPVAVEGLDKYELNKPPSLDSADTVSNFTEKLIGVIETALRQSVDKPEYLAIEKITTEDLSRYLPDFSVVRDSYKGILADLENAVDVPDLRDYQIESFEYAFTALWSGLESILSRNLQGSTGLDPAAERALLDRHRERIKSIIRDDINRVTAAIAGRGYTMPPGKLATALRMTTDKYSNEDIDSSTSILFKQAELMQSNMHHAIDASLRYEDMNSSIMFKSKGFEIEYKKFMLGLAVDIYKLSIERVKIKADILVSVGNLLELEIKNIQARVEMKRIELDQEKLKVDMNRALVSQYQAEIEGLSAQATYYRTMGETIGLLVNVDTLKTELFKTKLTAYGSYIGAVEADYRRYAEELKIATTPIEIQKALGDLYRVEANSIDTRNTSEVKRVEAVLAKFSNIVAAAGQEIKVGDLEIDRYTKTQGAYSEEYKLLVDKEMQKLKAATTQLNASLTGGTAKKDIILNKIEVAKFKLESYSNMLLAGGKSEVEAYGKEIDAIGKLLGSAYASVNAIGIDVNKL